MYCSFCGKNQNDVSKLIAGPSVFICDECVDLCNDIIREEIIDQEQAESEDYLPTPKEIRASLRRICYWPRSARKVLAVAVYNHYKR